VKAEEVTAIVGDDEFWEGLKMYNSLLKPLVRLIRLADSNMPSLGKVRKLIIRECIDCCPLELMPFADYLADV
jgi:hypothetical protein